MSPSCCAVVLCRRRTHTHACLAALLRHTADRSCLCGLLFALVHVRRPRPPNDGGAAAWVRKQQTIETSTDFTPTGPIGHTPTAPVPTNDSTHDSPPNQKPFRELCVSNRSSMPSPAPEFGVLRAAPSWVVRPPDDITTRPRKVQVATPHSVRFRMALFPRNFEKKN